jgi:hypothetical protein
VPRCTCTSRHFPLNYRKRVYIHSPKTRTWKSISSSYILFYRDKRHEPFRGSSFVDVEVVFPLRFFPSILLRRGSDIECSGKAVAVGDGYTTTPRIASAGVFLASVVSPKVQNSVPPYATKGSRIPLTTPDSTCVCYLRIPRQKNTRELRVKKSISSSSNEFQAACRSSRVFPVFSTRSALFCSRATSLLSRG